MRRSLLRWVRERRRPTDRFVSPSMTAYLSLERHRAAIDEDMQRHPEMCQPWVSKPTAHVTRIIDQGATVPVHSWNYKNDTWTMETAVVKR